MKIISAKVDWHEQYSNHPNLLIETDKLPEYDTMRYQERMGIYYAEREGFASYFYYTSPDVGFGGREFPITMKDGTKKTLKGPWSSRAACVNLMGFGPILDVVFKEADSKYKYCDTAGAVTLRIAQKAIKEFCPDVYLIPFVTPSGETIFTPSLEPGRLVKWAEPYGGGKRTKQVYDNKGMLVPA